MSARRLLRLTAIYISVAVVLGMVSVIAIVIASLISGPAGAQDNDTTLSRRSSDGANPTAQTLTAPMSVGGTTTSVTSALNWNQMPSDITIAAGSFTPPRKIILRKSKDCRLVVLNNTTEQIEIGCRTELTK